MTQNPLEPSPDEADSPDHATTRLLDLVAAVDYLRRGVRPGLTVWDAIEEALRDGEPRWDDPEPLRTALAGLLDRTTGPVDKELQAAIRRWVIATADRFNSGHHWPHPTPRRGFPPPALDAASADE